MLKGEKTSFKDQLFDLGQRLGKAILLPIAILPVAGLFFRSISSII